MEFFFDGNIALLVNVFKFEPEYCFYYQLKVKFH